MNNIRYDQAVAVLIELRDKQPEENEEYARGAAQAIARIMGCQDVSACAEALLTLAVYGKAVV